MVLCRFFLQGNCRFGSKCHNEHLDLKQVLKTDIDAAINGKQWPFSCYGPFKDKPCIPNFIEDQSFEEVRYLCYEAKKQNFFEQFHQQFTKEAIESTNKMRSLLQNPAIIDVVAKVHDTPDQVKAGAGAAPIANANPFGLTATNNNIGAGGSLFAKPSVNTGSIFSSGFGGSGGTTGGGSIFGGSSNNVPVSGGSIFGGSAPTNAPAAGGNLFAQQPAQQPSIFGGGMQQQQTNLFSQPQTNNGNLFGQQTATALPNTIGGNIFAQAQPQQQPQTSVGSGFGGNMFAQAAQQTSNLFGQATVQQQPQLPVSSGNVFGQPSTGSGGMFAQTAPATTSAPSNIFAQAVQSTAATSGFFASAAPTPFGQTPTPQMPFGQPAPATQQQAPSITSGMFGQQAVSMQPTLAQPQPQAQLQHIDYSIYSRMEDLSAEEIEAFKAPTFEPGKLPFSPPPRELIN